MVVSIYDYLHNCYLNLINDSAFLSIVSIIGILAFFSTFTWFIDAFRYLEKVRGYRDRGKPVGFTVFIRMILVIAGGVSLLRIYLLEPETGNIILLLGGTIGLVWFVYRRWLRQ